MQGHFCIPVPRNQPWQQLPNPGKVGISIEKIILASLASWRLIIMALVMAPVPECHANVPPRLNKGGFTGKIGRPSILIDPKLWPGGYITLA